MTVNTDFEIRKRIKQAGLILLAAGFLVSGCKELEPFIKKDKGIGQEKQVAKKTVVTATDVGIIVFDTATRRMIENYYRNNPHLVNPEPTESMSSGPGKGKGKGRKKGLPPGLAKKDKLPPGLQKRMLPNDLEGKLKPTPSGTERVRVDDKVLLIQRSTQLVLDIIDLAIK